MLGKQPPPTKQTLITRFLPVAPTYHTKKQSDTLTFKEKLSRTRFRKCLVADNPFDAKREWNNYLFCASSNFCEYKVVTLISRNDYRSKVQHPPGFVVATATVDDNSALESIEVKDGFRRQRIGTELVRFINSCCGKFIVFGGTEHNSRYRLTGEGAKLMRHCVSQKILDDTQVIFSVPPSPSLHL
jgi:hypothetical protein